MQEKQCITYLTDSKAFSVDNLLLGHVHKKVAQTREVVFESWMSFLQPCYFHASNHGHKIPAGNRNQQLRSIHIFKEVRVHFRRAEHVQIFQRFEFLWDNSTVNNWPQKGAKELNLQA